MVYSFSEDSELLLKNVMEYIKENKISNANILEMGCGSGVLIYKLATIFKNNNYFAIDIDPEAITETKQKTKDFENIKVIKSDLFEELKKSDKKNNKNNKQNEKTTFDLIFFNPPYLPNDKEFNSIDIHGGKQGNEITLRFLEESTQFINEKSVIFIIVSSLSKPRTINKFLKKNLFFYDIVDQKSFFYETLYVYRIKQQKHKNKRSNKGLIDYKTKELEKKYNNLKKINQGKRGIIFLINNDTCLKTSYNTGFLKREYIILKELNNDNIGPKVIEYDEKTDTITMEFINGKPIEEFIKTNKNKIKILKVILDCIHQTYLLDKKGYNKEEMNHPKKHIIISNENNLKKIKPRLIDFERCKPSNHPKNLTQFIQYLKSENIKENLKKKKIVFLIKNNSIIKTISTQNTNYANNGYRKNDSEKEEDFNEKLTKILREYKKEYNDEKINELKEILWFYPETTFEKVYFITRLIPKGKLTTYKTIAEIIKTDPRIVGFALNKNPLQEIIPCHRVIGKKNLLGYNKGKKNKKIKLKQEGINIETTLDEIKKHIVSKSELEEKYNKQLIEIRNCLK